VKGTNSAKMTFRDGRRWMWGAGLVVTVLAGAGCNKTDDASASATVQSPQDNINKQIEAIQNNPNMPADAKKRTIAAMQAKQSPGAK